MSAARSLNPNEIASLLKPKTPQRVDVGEQFRTAYHFHDGPLRHHDREMRCASRGCTSPTHFKLKGIAYCMMHCLRHMNELLTEGGEIASSS
jgi:hypothetical protein